MLKFATLFAGLVSAQTTTTTGGTKVGAAIEKIYAPTAIVSDTDGIAEFTKFELLQYKSDAATVYRTYTVETDWDPTNVTAGSDSWVYGAWFEFKKEDPCTMKFRFYETDNDTTAATTTTTSTSTTTTAWTGESPSIPCTQTSSF